MSKRVKSNGQPYQHTPSTTCIDNVCSRAIECLDNICKIIGSCPDCITINQTTVEPPNGSPEEEYPVPREAA